MHIGQMKNNDKDESAGLGHASITGNNHLIIISKRREILGREKI